MTNDASTTLEYAEPQAREKRWRRLKRPLLIAVALLALYAGWHWGVPFGAAAWEQVKFLSMQRRWMAHVDKPDLVVFDNDSAESIRLRAAGYDHVSIPSASGGDASAASAGYRGGAFGEYDQSMRPGGRAGGFAGGGVLLLRRRSPGGIERLVLVAAVLRQTPPAGRNVEIFAAAAVPAGLHPGSRPGAYTFSKTWPYLKDGERVRLYAGQPDPADESHFMIAYDLDGTPGVIDGWLRDDGSVDFMVRDGPLQGRQ